MANMVEGGKTPLLSAPELEKIGYSLVIFPGGFVRAMAKLGQRYFESLKKHGTTEPFMEDMLNFSRKVKHIFHEGFGGTMFFQ